MTALGRGRPGNSQRSLLVVDDEVVVRALVRLTCEREGYAVGEAQTGEGALESVAAIRPDLILLDLVLPDISGFDVCRRIRRTGSRVPIIMLSARSEEIDVVIGLEIGADDYMIKPFRPRELLARIAAQLRRAEQAMTTDDDVRMVFRDLVIDVNERRVYKGDLEVPLTHTEFDLLSYLAGNPGRALSREKILDSVWGAGYPIESRVIDVHVRNLRRKIEDHPSTPHHILTVPGVGYRFTAAR